MTAIIDGVAVIGTPEEINSLLILRDKEDTAQPTSNYGR